MNTTKILTILLLVLSFDSYADCSCETYAIIDISFKDRSSNTITRNEYFTRWWSLSRAMHADVYSRDPIENKKIAGLSVEQQLSLELNPVEAKSKYPNILLRKSKFVKIDISHTPKIKGVRGENVSFDFKRHKEIILQDKYDSLGEVVEIHSLKVGCEHKIPTVSDEEFKILRDRIPDKVKFLPDLYGFGNGEYKFGYELKDEYLNRIFHLPASGC
ncbi:hypothetical protein OLEAN_C21880 [Oleispira antarctica RB-8]|uniref:Uncharacterized protein n=1 Tax=Oleispira antarctica RB-8 TaxID=698738 RepID=R4YU46_OLEAN|nr:hypothetical protein OLEAN_C21880 [Oleispira antarctica RB-8]